MSDLSPIERNLELEELDYDIYRSIRELWRPKNARGIFGGAVIGQALSAACRTVPDGYNIHSLHSYFVLRGDETRPVVYHVERVRDGKSYITRTVQARQRNKVIFTVTCSFQKPETSRLSHATAMPKNLPDPGTLPSDAELLSSEAVMRKFSPEQLTRFQESTAEVGPIESKRVFTHFVKPPRSSHTPDSSSSSNVVTTSPTTRTKVMFEASSKRQSFWVRAKGPIKSPNFHVHAMAIAYFSDSWFLSTALLVNGTPITDASMMASLDHSIYFHRPCRADEWLYFEMESPWSGGGRGLAIGRVFTRDGELVAECIQEGLIRMKPQAKI